MQEITVYHTTDLQNRGSLNVYAKIICNTVISPYFFDSYRNCHKFLLFLEQEKWDLYEFPR